MALLRRLATAQCRYNFDVVAVHVSRRYNSLADLATRFQALSEFNALLPDGVVVGPLVRRCRIASPADSSPVFACRLTSRDELASSRLPQPTTPTRSRPSTPSAAPPAWMSPSPSIRSASSASGSSRAVATAQASGS